MRHKVDWFIPQQILALSHLIPEVTAEDFIEIMSATQTRLQEVDKSFHLIIDNRIIKSEEIVSLETILQSIPQLQSLPLNQIIIILPYKLRDKADKLETQSAGNTHLMYVDSLATALTTLETIDSSLDWEGQVLNFFAKDR